MTQLVLIALDGATLDLLKPWMTAGKLPLLNRLFQEGAGGTLMSTVPWATPTAFASLATGTNPGKHGIFDFGKLIKENYTAFVPTNGSHIKQPTLWRLLSNAGISSAVINMPMTYPAERIKGQVIAGIPYPSGSPHLCHPPHLLDDLRTHGWDLSLNSSDDLGGNYTTYYQGLLSLIRNRAAATAHLIQEHNPDAVFVHFLEPDQVQHRYWIFMQGEKRYRPDGEHTNAILNLFQETEKAMQLILDSAGPDATICVMSDHGFGPMRHQVWLNNWLRRHHYLTLHNTLNVKFKQLIYSLGLSPATIRENLPERLKMSLLQFFERQKGRAIASEQEQENDQTKGKNLGDWLTERLAIDFYDVDWSQTVAFSTGTTSVGYVWLNVKRRDPQGIVEPGVHYKRQREEIARHLAQWEAVGEVLPREEVWYGRELHYAPDLVVKWAMGSTDARFFQTRFSSHHLMKPVPNDNACHRPNGLFVLHGQGVHAGQTITADLIDLTPTFLWLLKQPIPTYMDGRVLTECFTHPHPVQHIDWVAPPPEDTSDFTLSHEDESAIMDTLRGLGYME